MNGLSPGAAAMWDRGASRTQLWDENGSKSGIEGVLGGIADFVKLLIL
jgi:hypothetical protein